MAQPLQHFVPVNYGLAQKLAFSSLAIISSTSSLSLEAKSSK